MRVNEFIFLPFLPEASFGLRALPLPASICASVCAVITCSHDDSGSVQARITKFGPMV